MSENVQLPPQNRLSSLTNTMELDHQICSRARLARDARFDGKFFIGVLTTRIYCRPICRARTSKECNVRYFLSAAAAAEAGFRPCLRCRPECSPGTPAWVGTRNTVSRALQLISETWPRRRRRRSPFGTPRHRLASSSPPVPAPPGSDAQRRCTDRAVALRQETDRRNKFAHDAGCSVFRVRLRSPIQRSHPQRLSLNPNANPRARAAHSRPAAKSVSLPPSLPPAIQLEARFAVPCGTPHARRRIGRQQRLQPLLFCERRRRRFLRFS